MLKNFLYIYIYIIYVFIYFSCEISDSKFNIFNISISNQLVK